MKRLPKRNQTTTTTKEPETTMTEPLLPSTSNLATIGSYQEPEQVDLSIPDEKVLGKPFRYLRFFSGKADNAVDVKMALGKTIVEGHPYVCWSTLLPIPAGSPEGTAAEKQEHYADVSKTRCVVLHNFPHWITRPEGGRAGPDRCWLKAQPFGAKVGKARVQESFNAVLLFLPADGEAPEAPFLAIAEVRGTKAPFIKDFLRGCDMVTKPGKYEKIDRKGNKSNVAKDLIQRVGAKMDLPPLFRAPVAFNMIPKQGSNFPYALAKGVVDPITDEEVAVIRDWESDPDRERDYDAVVKHYEKKCEEMRALAAATKDVPA